MLKIRNETRKLLFHFFLESAFRTFGMSNFRPFQTNLFERNMFVFNYSVKPKFHYFYFVVDKVANNF